MPPLKLYIIVFSLFIFDYAFASQDSKIDSLRKVLRAAERSEEVSGTLVKIGDYYYESKEFKKAIKNYNKAIQTSKDINDFEGMAVAQNKIGIVYASGEMDYDEALSHFETALNTAKAHNLSKLVKDISANIADVKNKLALRNTASEKYDKLKNLKKEDALQLISEENLKREEESKKREEENKKREEENLNFLEKIKTLNAANQLIALKLKFKQHEVERNEMAIDLLNKDKELKNAELGQKDAELGRKDAEIAKTYAETQQQRAIILFSSIALLSLIAFAFILYRSYLQKQKANDLLMTKNRIIEEKNKKITDSIMYAKKIQDAILTPKDHFKKVLPSHFILYKPKDIVSGDFYRAYSLQDNLAVWMVADCTGHGIPGAFMSLIATSLLNEIIVERKITVADDILNELNSKIIKALGQSGVTGEVRDGMDIALCIWHKDTNKLEYAGAFNPLYLIRKNKLTIVQPDKKPIGYHYSDVESKFTRQEIQLETGDMVYLFSDGYVDQFGGERSKKFSRKRFKELLLSIHTKPIEEQKQILDKTLENWKGETEEQVDDICVTGVKI